MRNSKKVYNTKAQYKKYYVFTNYIDLNILFVFIRYYINFFLRIVFIFIIKVFTIIQGYNHKKGLM